MSEFRTAMESSGDAEHLLEQLERHLHDDMRERCLQEHWRTEVVCREVRTAILMYLETPTPLLHGHIIGYAQVLRACVERDRAIVGATR